MLSAPPGGVCRYCAVQWCMQRAHPCRCSTLNQEVLPQATAGSYAACLLLPLAARRLQLPAAMQSAHSSQLCSFLMHVAADSQPGRSAGDCSSVVHAARSLLPLVACITAVSCGSLLPPVAECCSCIAAAWCHAAVCTCPDCSCPASCLLHLPPNHCNRCGAMQPCAPASECSHAPSCH